MLLMFFSILRSFYNIGKRIRVIINNLVFMGVESTFITIIMSFFVGVVLALQTGYQLNKFNLNNLLGAIVGLSLLKELAPVQTAILVAGKVGSAITAELATMKISEEVDALNIMGIDVFNYLVFPKFLACTLTTVVLVIFTDFIGFLGGAFIAYQQYNISFETFFDSFASYTETIDLVINIIKAFSFGIIISLISCYFGMRTDGGPEAVGQSTTNTVVVSFMSVLIANFFITRIMMFF